MCGILCWVAARKRPHEPPAHDDREWRTLMDKRGPDARGAVTRARAEGDDVEVHMEATILHVRGDVPGGSKEVPMRNKDGGVLLFNGEVLGGLDVDERVGDTKAVCDALCEACACDDADADANVAAAMARVRGPWAFVFFHAPSNTLWFGRDVYGRRSLLVHLPRSGDPRFVLASVAPPNARVDVAAVASASPTDGGNGYDSAANPSPPSFWTDLPPGVYKVSLNKETRDLPPRCIPPALPWPEASLPWRIAPHERPARLSEPPPCAETDDAARATAVAEVLAALTAAVRARVADATLRAHLAPASGAEAERAPAAVAVLFSGGVDSMLLARIAADCLPADAAIDLVNVCFANGTSPDRITASDGIDELAAACPAREFRLVEVNATLEDVDAEAHRLMALLHPACTHMDYNIGASLWFAAGCRGTCRIRRGDTCEEVQGTYEGRAKVLLTGGGADEQCCGYGRHRTSFRNGGWSALAAESSLDMNRIWLRNCGRDDRVVSDRSREMRWPFLDEALVLTLLAQPLWTIADLREPHGQGDKAVLRAVAARLGLPRAAARPKRAMHFGTRIAKQLNCRVFGSNSAANKAKEGAREMVVL